MILNGGLIINLLMATYGVYSGSMTVGGFVLANALFS